MSDDVECDVQEGDLSKQLGKLSFGSQTQNSQDNEATSALREKARQATKAAAEAGCDKRCKLTPEEFRCVRELKELCDARGVKYASIFELAKYVIAVWSNEAEKRVHDSFANIQKRRKFEEENADMLAFDMETCIKAVEEHTPDFYKPSGTPLDGLWHVATAPGTLDWKKLDTDNKLMLKVSNFYLQATALCAVDLEELRRGIGILTDYNGVSVFSVFTTIRVLQRLTKLTAGPAHAARLKKVSVLIPSTMVPFAHLGVSVAPQKIRERIDLAATIDKFQMDDSQLHPYFQGEYQLSIRDWVSMRTIHAEKYASIIEKEYLNQCQSEKVDTYT